jgi:hypothetical protein
VLIRRYLCTIPEQQDLPEPDPVQDRSPSITEAWHGRLPTILYSVCMHIRFFSGDREHWQTARPSEWTEVFRQQIPTDSIGALIAKHRTVLSTCNQRPQITTTMSWRREIKPRWPRQQSVWRTQPTIWVYRSKVPSFVRPRRRAIVPHVFDFRCRLQLLQVSLERILIALPTQEVGDRITRLFVGHGTVFHAVQ